MSWLLRDGDVLAAVEDRRRGWQASLQGALVLRGPALVQTLTPDPARGLDVAWCAPADGDGGRRVLRVRRITVIGPPPGVAAPSGWRRPGGGPGRHLRAWRLQVGDCLEVRGA